MSRLDTERQKKIEPIRLVKTKEKLEALGYQVTQFGNNRLEFSFKGHTVRFWPYSGWATGKTINDGRGFNRLLKQLRNGTTK